LWADARVVQSLFNRGNTAQVFRAALASPESFAAFEEFVENDPRLQLEAQTEQAYYAAQASGTISIIQWIGWPLSIIMGIGALAGALNTMYSSVAARSAEIATLRIIGFSGSAAFFGTLIEALALSFIGALVAVVACFALFNGMTASTLGSGFTQVVFQLKITPELVTQAIIMALIIGLVGGIFPGIRAARKRPQLELAAQ
jgi:putative ABC transport system permease protein